MRKLASGLAFAAACIGVAALGSRAEAALLNAPQGLRPAIATVDVAETVHYRSRRWYRGRYVYVGPRYRYRRAYYRGPRYYYARGYYVAPRYRYRRAYYGWPGYYYPRPYYGPRVVVGGPGFYFGFGFGGRRYWW